MKLSDIFETIHYNGSATPMAGKSSSPPVSDRVAISRGQRPRILAQLSGKS